MGGIARPASAVLNDLLAMHGADEPAKSVRSRMRKYLGRNRFPVIGASGSESHLQRGVTYQPIGVKGLVPLIEIVDRAVDPVLAIDGVLRRIRDVLPAPLAFFVSQRDSRHALLALVHYEGVLHSQRIEDRLFQKLCITLAGQAFDDLAEHDIGGVAVCELFAG